MKLCFDSIEEVREFIGNLKGTRGGKGAKDGDNETGAVTGAAPGPIQPPTQFAPQPAGTPGAPQFAPPPGAGAFPAGPAAGAAQVGGGDHAAIALAQRIGTRLDAAIASGQPAEQARAWVASQIAAATNNAAASGWTLDQVKAALVTVPLPALESIAKLMNA